MVDDRLQDRCRLRELIEAWVVWRDGGDFDSLAGLWHPDGFIMTTWCEASAAEFIARSREARESGIRVFHTVDGSQIDVEGARAIALTKMQISATLSSMVSANSRFSRPFSSSGAFSLRASETSIPPNLAFHL